MYVHQVCIGALRGPKRVLDLPELALQMVMSLHTGLGIKSGSSVNAMNGLNCKAISVVLPVDPALASV